MKSIDIKYQQYLKDMKLYEGKVDGKYGPKTESAIRKYQKINGLIADGIIGPKTRKELDEDLDVVLGRSDEDTSEIGIQPYTRWPKENSASLTKFYGEVGKNQVRIDVPYRMVLAWDTDHVVKQIMCNKKVSESLYKVLETVAKEYSEAEIKKHGFNLFGGCLNVRRIRGGTRWSTHAWGIAVDFDPARNGLRMGADRAYFAKPECKVWREIWKSEGWYGLGPEKNYDYMHWQACYR